MYRNTNFLKSVFCAASGFWYALRRERNLRFHLVITNLICVFAYFYGLTRTQWAILVLMILLMIITELVNTSIERTVDTATQEYCATAKAAKDVAAAAVLFSAAGALCVGCFLFLDPAKIADAIHSILASPQTAMAVAVLTALDLLFLLFAGKHQK